MHVAEIPVHLVGVDCHRRRPLDEAKVARIAESMQSDGLLHPISVRMDGDSFRLIAGAYRLEAATHVLKWETIPATICDADDDQARMMELAENVQRVELSTDERDAFIREYAERVKAGQADPVSDKGGRGRIGICTQVAKALGLHKKTVQRALNGGKRSYPPKKQDQLEAPSAAMMLEQALVLIRGVWDDLTRLEREAFQDKVAVLSIGGEQAPWERSDRELIDEGRLYASRLLLGQPVPVSIN